MRLLTRKSAKRSSPTSFLQSDAYRNHKESDILDAASSSSNGRKSSKTTRRGFSQLRQQFALKSTTTKVILVVSILSVASILIGLAVYVIFWLYHHGQCYRREAGVHFVEGPAHFMERQCPPPAYETISKNDAKSTPNICITSLTDAQSPSRWQRMIRCRDFDALPTLPKMQAYAQKHGYTFVDSSSLIDTSRPPAWSKIRAVQALLSESNDKRCDWVLWWDADILIMNSDIRIESLLPTGSSPIHLVATFDRKFTVNSGAWLIRNSLWSMQFLEAWWNHAAWVRRPGMSLSGDNAAFGHFVSNLLDNPTEASHIAIPERCNLNSFGVFLTEQQKPLESMATDYSKEEWYMSPKFYHKGDFVVHASGIDQKGAVLELMAERAT